MSELVKNPYLLNVYSAEEGKEDESVKTDIYQIIRAFFPQGCEPALAHALKKMLKPGSRRGDKTTLQDLKEAAVSLGSSIAYQERIEKELANPNFGFASEMFPQGMLQFHYPVTGLSKDEIEGIKISLEKEAVNLQHRQLLPSGMVFKQTVPTKPKATEPPFKVGEKVRLNGTVFSEDVVFVVIEADNPQYGKLRRISPEETEQSLRVDWALVHKYQEKSDWTPDCREIVMVKKDGLRYVTHDLYEFVGLLGNGKWVVSPFNTKGVLDHSKDIYVDREQVSSRGDHPARDLFRKGEEVYVSSLGDNRVFQGYYYINGNRTHAIVSTQDGKHHTMFSLKFIAGAYYYGTALEKEIAPVSEKPLPVFVNGDLYRLREATGSISLKEFIYLRPDDRDPKVGVFKAKGEDLEWRLSFADMVPIMAKETPPAKTEEKKETPKWKPINGEIVYYWDSIPAVWKKFIYLGSNNKATFNGYCLESKQSYYEVFTTEHLRPYPVSQKVETWVEGKTLLLATRGIHGALNVDCVFVHWYHNQLIAKRLADVVLEADPTHAVVCYTSTKGEKSFHLVDQRYLVERS